jgi:integrase
MKNIVENSPNRKRIDNIYENLSEKNKEFINKFLEYKQGYITPCAIHSYKYRLTRIADLLEKDFDQATKEDITKIGGLILDSTFTDKTKEDFICAIKTSYKFWFGENEYYPKVVSCLKRPKKRSILKLPQEMLSEEQLYKMIKACPSTRDQFFIALIGLDAALRPCEARGIRWGDIKKDKYGYFITVYTAKKSGIKETRTVRIIKSEPYFVKWCEAYPLEKSDTSFVFISTKNFKQWSQNGGNALFRRLRTKLNISKRIYPYLMRHSLITKMSKDPNIPISVLKKFIGHSLRSNTISEYIHYGDEDLMDMQLQYNGITKVREKKDISVKPIVCSKCEKSNAYDAEFCYFCNTALSQKRMVESAEKMTALQEQLATLSIELDKRKQLDPILDKLLNNPKILELVNHN